MKDHQHPSFAYSTFAVLDEDTTKNKTCRIGSTSDNTEEGDKMLTTDFFASMYFRVPVEMATRSWCEEVWGYAGKVFDRKCIEESKRKT